MKRFFDLLISLSLIILTSPLWLLIGLLVRFSIGGNVFFIQKRVGKDCKEFNIIKFTTMKPVVSNESIVDEKSRLTSISRFLRKSSLDEIPELLNVIKGDMSIIGPRPLLPEYIPLYSKIQNLRHKVKPGITGLAQVSGRNKLSWRKKFQYDMYYLRNQSFCFDVLILLKTLKILFQFRDANATEDLSMPKFTGRN